MIECGFKDVKRGGFHWEQTKMTDPARATRLWLAIAVATLWVASVGDAADARLSTSMLDDMDTLLPTERRSSKRARAYDRVFPSWGAADHCVLDCHGLLARQLLRARTLAQNA